MTKSSARSSSSPNKHSKKRKGFNVEQRKSKKPKAMRSASKTAAEDVINRASQMNVGDTNGQLRASVVSLRYGNAATKKNVPTHGGKSKKKKLKLHKTLSGAAPVEVEKSPVDQAAFRRDVNGAKRNEKNNSALSKMLEKFTVDNSTYSLAKIRATFYPKFEFEKSDREIRTRMIDLVSKGLATLEVSLKHSGSLFMYAGCESGAYAKNSFGNIYTAVGVFVLGRAFQEAWGGQANKKQSKFNAYIERKRMCISMELVTAVLGDHGQRPREDYVVVTAVTELGKGKPVFYSTPDIIRFCRKWRLPTNHVWMFSTRKSVTSFFAVYDALCEEGTATPVCQALDEVADLLIPGSKDHTKMQGEILEGLVARIVSHESSKRMVQVLNETSHQLDGVDLDLGPSLREICAANRSDEKKLVKALLQTAGTSFCPNFVDWFGNEGTDKQSKDADELFVSKFLQANPSDLSTTKCQEMIRLLKEKRIPAAFRCHYNFQKAESMSSDNLHFKMVVHILYDKAFQRYQKEMRYKPGLWPLYRGFFVDVNLYKTSNERASSDIANNSADVINNVNESNEISGNGGLADEDVNLMIKMKFLTYKLRTFLIRNGLSILFKEGPGAYKAYYMRQMKRWNTSQSKQREISKLLDEWAHYIRGKYGHKQLTPSKYLTEVEPFLESYGKQSPQNQALIGSAGNMVRAEDISAIIDSGKDEEEDVEMENQVALSNISASVVKDEGLIIFFPGIPGCGKSALCKEILSLSEGIGDGRPVQSLMGDLTKGNYWAKVGEERKRKPYSVMLADKNAPNAEVWKQIEGLCLRTKASAVPVVPDCEGTETNPYSLDALAVFTFRVLLRAKHPGKLDNACPTAGHVLLKFYHLFDGQDRIDFETELVECFGSLVKMPLLKPDRNPLPEPVRSVLEEGINLFKLHFVKHGRLQSNKGMYAPEWSKWEKKLRDILFGNAEYLNSIQVPFQYTVERVLEQLRTIAKGEYPRLSTEKKKLGCIIFAAVDLSVTDIQALLCSLAKKKSMVDAFLKDKNMDVILKQAHLTLAHKKSQGVTAVANYGSVVHKNVPVKMTALFFSDKFAALEAHLGSVDGEEVKSMIKWPHITLWTANGVTCKEAVTLPQLYSEGKATRIKIKPPVTIVGTVEFH